MEGFFLCLPPLSLIFSYRRAALDELAPYEALCVYVFEAICALSDCSFFLLGDGTAATSKCDVTQQHGIDAFI